MTRLLDSFLHRLVREEDIALPAAAEAKVRTAGMNETQSQTTA